MGRVKTVPVNKYGSETIVISVKYDLWNGRRNASEAGTGHSRRKTKKPVQTIGNGLHRFCETNL